MKARMLLTIGIALLAVVAMAGENFAYQGVLQDSAGAAMASKTPSVTFKLYAEATGGTALWGRVSKVSTDANGMFNIELSDSLASAGGLTATLDGVFAATLKKGKDLYIGLTIENGSEIAPRQKVLSVPLASVANTIRKASGNFAVGGAVTFGGAATFRDTTTFAGGATLSGNTEFQGTTTFEGDIGITKDAIGTMPVGAIVMWWGAKESIPRGWHLCDGTKVGNYQTPDMRNRIPLGAKDGGYPFKSMSGEKEVKLTIATMPSHTHEFIHEVDESAQSDFKRTRGGEKYNPGSNHVGFKFERSLYVYDTIDIGNWESGGDEAHDNMPPYTAIYFIIRVQ